MKTHLEQFKEVGEQLLIDAQNQTTFNNNRNSFARLAAAIAYEGDKASMVEVTALIAKDGKFNKFKGDASGGFSVGVAFRTQPELVLLVGKQQTEVNEDKFINILNDNTVAISSLYTALRNINKAVKAEESRESKALKLGLELQGLTKKEAEKLGFIDECQASGEAELQRIEAANSINQVEAINNQIANLSLDELQKVYSFTKTLIEAKSATVQAEIAA